MGEASTVSEESITARQTLALSSRLDAFARRLYPAAKAAGAAFQIEIAKIECCDGVPRVRQPPGDLLNVALECGGGIGISIQNRDAHGSYSFPKSRFYNVESSCIDKSTL